ncbi:hypothetical protein P13BB106kb_p006 [Pectobacterium phage DU_PP_V]|uniref:Uncharacterized protein n=1 Tax=Pectobacterium phage DU_PP_V TaxID=2041492 RepID=A0A2D2W732_9CAUD|nr:hypothetical protein HOS40_gp006 [Pectobacterium phage DU_PP_V]ATS93990.1 hypothetical protein P13BB106kb_p006 [Pectobacterium phage DU_PP_V]
MKETTALTVTPKIGQSVYVPFVTVSDAVTGSVEYQGGCALIPFDKIDSVYSDTDTNRKGNKIYGVRLKSGDRVDVVLKEHNENQTLWQAIR